MKQFIIYDPNTGKPEDTDIEPGKQIPTTISYGYDRTERSWCIILEDQNGCQIGNEMGEADYVSTWEEAFSIITKYQNKYNIDENHVQKVRAY